MENFERVFWLLVLVHRMMIINDHKDDYQTKCLYQKQGGLAKIVKRKLVSLYI